MLQLLLSRGDKGRCGLQHLPRQLLLPEVTSNDLVIAATLTSFRAPPSAKGKPHPMPFSPSVPTDLLGAISATMP